MKNLPLLIGTIVGTVVLIVAIAFMSSSSVTTDQAGQTADISVVLDGARHLEKVMEEEVATNSAEVVEQELITIVEFSDFQCPACKSSLPALQRVKDLYPELIQVSYRHFPLDSIHPNARLAAIASEAAASLDESKFWSFHDRLFEEQQVWSDISSRTELKEKFASYAVELGLDKDQFLEKLEDDSVAELVNKDVASGTKLGVNSTPTFYVNGLKVSAPQLLTAVESLLVHE